MNGWCVVGQGQSVRDERAGTTVVESSGGASMQLIVAWAVNGTLAAGIILWKAEWHLA